MYLATLSPTINHRDSPEFVVSAFTLGISHPAGFPTYNLLAKGFTFLPFGSVALKINLFSAVSGCLALAVLYLASVRLLAWMYPEEKESSRLIGAALIPVLLLGFSWPFWFHSLVAEVYTLHALFIALVILLLVLWKEKQDYRFLYGAALVYGLGAGNHATTAFMLPAILVLFYFWTPDRRWRHLLVSAGFFLIGLSVYAYLPIRSLAEPSMDWGNPETVSGFLYQVTDRKNANTHFSYFSDSLAAVPASSSSIWAKVSAIPLKFQATAKTLLVDLNRYLTPLMALGFLAGTWVCWKRNRCFLIFCLLVAGVNAAFFAGWKRESYFPSYIIACLLTSLALYAFVFRPLGETAKDDQNRTKGSGVSSSSLLDWRRWVLMGSVVAISWNVMSNYPRVDRSGLYFAESLLKRVFLSLEDRSLFVTGMSWFNFFYHNDVERLRDDVTAVKAWDLLERDPPAILTPVRYPDLDLPDPRSHRFDTRKEAFRYTLELLDKNSLNRPVMVEQNLTLMEEFPLADRLRPYRNLLLKYEQTSDPISPEKDSSFAEFKELLQADLNRPGIYRTEWINKVAFYIPSFAEYYHDKKWYAREREVLWMMREFLGLGDLNWQFQWIDNLILDGKLNEARKAFKTLQRDFPNHFKTRLAEGLLLRAEGNLDDALTLLVRAVQINPFDFRARLELGRIYRKTGKPEQAKTEWDAARKYVRSLRQWKTAQHLPVS